MLLKYDNSTEFSSIVRHVWYSIDQEGYSIKTVSNDQWWPLSSYLGVVGTLLNLSVLYMFVQVHTQHWTNLVLLTISINTFIKYAIALTYNWLMSIWCISGEARSGDCCQCHDMVGYNGCYEHRSYLFIYIY